MPYPERTAPEPACRLAVLRFVDATGSDGTSWYTTRLGDAMAGALAAALHAAGPLRVVQRSGLDHLIDEPGFGENGGLTPAVAARFGRAAGVRLVVTVAVAQVRAGRSGTGRLLDAFGPVGASRMVADVGIVDVRTSESFGHRRIEAAAREVDLVAWFRDPPAAIGPLSDWYATPKGRALRELIGLTVEHVLASVSECRDATRRALRAR